MGWSWLMQLKSLPGETILLRFVDAIDLNCGCPQRWAIQEKIGSYFMDVDPQLICDMIKQTKGRVHTPVSIKMRVHSDLKRTVQMARNIEAAGARWITVHGRLRSQKSSEPVNYEAIKLVRENVSIPVIANGDIFSLEDANTVQESTGVRGVMAARGLLRNPALFSGFSSTPFECVRKYIDEAVSYGTPFFIFHHHLIYMLEDELTTSEKKVFNSLSNFPQVINFLSEHLNFDFYSQIC
jgi:tRNA-dihydrouridine synthase 4